MPTAAVARRASVFFTNESLGFVFAAAGGGSVGVGSAIGRAHRLGARAHACTKTSPEAALSRAASASNDDTFPKRRSRPWYSPIAA